MPTSPQFPGEVGRRYYHLAIFCIGVAIAVVAAVELARSGRADWRLLAVALVVAPLVAIVARFPMVLDSDSGAIEVGFDSSVLMFLLCTYPIPETLLTWSAGVLLTQLISGKPAAAKIFNIGLGILVGAMSAGVVAIVGGNDLVGTARGLLAIGCAAAAYFLGDYVLSGLSVAICAGTSLLTELRRRETLFAIACFVPLDSLGYLGAVVHRTAPWWALSLLGVPLATLLFATHAVTRGRENARRLTVLFGAAVRAQTLGNRDDVVQGLVEDASQLVRLRQVEIRSRPPEDGEIGVHVQLGRDAHWLVARAINRASASVAADEQALQALSAVASDAVSRLELTNEMVHVARHDPLTDLPNRGILLDRVTVALRTARADGTAVALVFLDLDGFKPVNDRFGHAVGDAVLKDVAHRLRASVPDAVTIARVGGDEFAILLVDVDRRAAEEICEAANAAFADSVEVEAHRLRLGASLGLAYASDSDTAASLLRNADLAMYEAKTRGKGGWVVYEPAMGRARLERLELADDLRRAVEGGEIEVVYQPVISVETGLITGAEALARWRHDGVPVPPDVFISVAEETGLIVALGDVVLRRVAADAATVCVAADHHCGFSVNISAGQLRDPRFVASVTEAVETMRGTRLVLELTERQGVDLDAGILATMRRITSMGVDFAIDDFGVGFSSISYLHDLPARILKADAALVQDIDQDERARALLRSVMLMGHELAFDIVVEGIERATQLAVVREDAPGGRTLAQGFYLHAPMPLEHLRELMTSQAQRQADEVTQRVTRRR